MPNDQKVFTYDSKTGQYVEVALAQPVQATHMGNQHHQAPYGGGGFGGMGQQRGMGGQQGMGGQAYVMGNDGRLYPARQQQYQQRQGMGAGQAAGLGALGACCLCGPDMCF